MPQSRFLFCAVLLLATLGLSIPQTVLAQAVIQTPRPAGLPTTLFGYNFYHDDDIPDSLPQTLSNQIRYYSNLLEMWVEDGDCARFEQFYEGDNIAYVEGYLNELAGFIGRFSPDGANRARADVRQFIAYAGRLERRGCGRDRIESAGAATAPGAQTRERTPKVEIGADIQRTSGPGNLESFGFRLGPGLETFFSLPLADSDSQVAPSFAVSIPLPDAVWFEDIRIEGLGFQYEVGAFAPIVASNGNPLLLPGSTTPGFSLPGGGTATDVFNASNTYQATTVELNARLSRRWMQRPSRDPNSIFSNNWNWTNHIGVSVRNTDTSQNVAGTIPNFGFGPDFGFSYMTDIDVQAVGVLAGFTLDRNLGTVFGGQLQGTLGGEIGLFQNDVSASDQFMLAHPGATFANQIKNLDRTDTAVNFRLSAGLSLQIPIGAPEDGRSATISSMVEYLSTEDAYSVHRSGAVGGQSTLQQDRFNSVGGRLSLKFRF